MTTTKQTIEKIVFLMNSTGHYKMTIEFLTERYEEILNKHGIDQAASALQYHLKEAKDKSKSAEKILLTKVKYEAFDKFKGCPTALKDIRAGIVSGIYAALPSGEEWLQRYTHLQWASKC